MWGEGREIGAKREGGGKESELGMSGWWEDGVGFDDVAREVAFPFGKRREVRQDFSIGMYDTRTKISARLSSGISVNFMPWCFGMTSF